MASLVLTNPKLLIGGYDFSGKKTKVGLNYGSELQDETTFGQTTRKRKSGLYVVGIDAEGLVDFADNDVDEQYFSNIGQQNIAAMVSHDGGDDGELAFITRLTKSKYSPGGAIGELMKFTVAGEGNDALVRGTIMHNATRTSSSTGTARQLGAVSATQKLYATLHVLSVSGTSPTLDVVVRSDDNSGMSSPTNRITFTQATAITSQWATPVSGAITDDYWQVTWTIGGSSTPTFQFVVVIGIQ